MLHADLGVSNAEEATQIFERSSMDSILDDDDDLAANPRSKNGHSSDFFRNIKFGPIGSNLSVPTSPSLGCGPTTLLSGNLERRRSSILGFGDWPLSAGVARPNEIPDLACNVDDYFGEESLQLENVTSIPKSENRFPRRQSQVAEDLTDLDEQFMNLAFSSSPKGTASAGCYHGMASPYFGHSSAASIHGFGGADFDDIQHGGYYHSQQQQQSQQSHHHRYAGGESSFQLNSYTGPLWAVEFKSGRTEIFYVLEEEGAPEIPCKVGDLVIVEADRGEDLGKVTAEISVAKMRSFISSSSSDDVSLGEDENQDKNQISPELATLLKSKEIIPKRIHRLATQSDLKMLQAKSQEEALAMVRCQSRIRQKKLPMDVVDAEYQWDRNKLTFFFVADRRIDFRELVRDLFRIYKTRIWMCAVDKHSPRMINYLGGLVPVHRIKQEDDTVSRVE
jgi:cell fate regulator YaaT (PSP1 superfamily)